MKVSILAIILTLLFSGCDTPVYESRVTIEQDGPIYSAYPDEIDESSDNIELLKEYLSRNYDNVDNNIYNFIVVLPIKTKDDLYAEFHKSGQGNSNDYFTISNCNKTEFIMQPTDTFFLTYKYTKDSNGTLHYKLYSESNILKYLGLFENIDAIGDICIDYYNYEVNEFNYINDYTSNEIVIKAQEIKDMLDNLGIYYEDESN